MPEGLKDRVEEALKESVAVAARGRRYVDHVRARLDFSKDSESSSSKAAVGATPGGWQTAAEELGESLEEEFGEETEEPGRPAEGLETDDVPEGEAAETRGAAPRYLVEFMRSFGQMRANDSGWPTFDGRYVNYPRFKKEWGAYRQTYHSAVSDDLAARTLRDKCLQGDALQMVTHLDDLREMWETLDTCYERPDKYAEEALRPIVDFRRYKIADSAAVREFYSLLRAAIKGARKIGRVELVINDQTIPRIMRKMPHIDWKEWATKRPDWMRQDATSAFEAFIERKWLDALNIAATEPTPWRGDGEKAAGGICVLDKAIGSGKGVLRLTGAVNVIERGETSRSPSPLWDLSFGRKGRARNLIGCNGDHVMLQCEKLMSLGLAERRDVLEKSGLCMFCLKHAAELECYGRGGLSKPGCTQAGCDGEHTPGVHKLMGEDNAGVTVVAGDESEDEDEVREEDEDEGWWVGTIGAMEMLGWAGEAPCDAPCMERAHDNDGQTQREHEPMPGQCSASGIAGDEWWGLESECLGPEEEGPDIVWPEAMQHSLKATVRSARPRSMDRQEVKRKPRADTDWNWKEAGQSAWGRQLLSDDSSDEDKSEVRCGRFAESGRWMSELYGYP